MASKQIELLDKRWSSLTQERASWWGHWIEISQFLLPRQGRYFSNDHNKGWKRQQFIYDSTGTRALRILAAGMMSGMTSPSRPWFRLAVSHSEAMDNQAIKLWLNQVTVQIEDELARSNAYRVLHGLYEELGAFGTAAALIGDDVDHSVHLFPFTIGEYAIASNWQGEVVTLYREFEKTVAEVVRSFGLDNCSALIQNAYRRGDLDKWVRLRHAIEPRQDRISAALDNKNMAWTSCYWEVGQHAGHLLRESGFQRFPCLVPRWLTTSGDIYGNSPGMEALGDIKQLQLDQLRKSQAIDYQANPPVQIPTSMKNRELEIFPGGISYYDANMAQQSIKTAFDVNLNVDSLLQDITDIRGRINGAFYSDLFLMISQQPANGSMTATEVAARNEEKLLMLGPVVERLSNELLDPLVETVFSRLLKAGLLPTPPAELQGHTINIEYISMLSQAQKAVTVNGIDRFVSAIGQVAVLKPDVLDKFDADHWADLYSDKLGVDPELLVSGKQLGLLRQQRDKQNQQIQRNAVLQQASDMLKNAGQTSTAPGTVAGDMMTQLKK